MRRTLVAFALALPLAAAVPARAQTVPPLVIGARVRVEPRYLKVIEGTLMSQTQDSLVIASVGAVRTVVSSYSVVRIKASQGKSHGAGAIKGLKIGASIGAVSGFLIGIAYAGYDNTPKEELVASATAAYAVSGGVWGLAIGGIVGAEKWTTVYELPMRLAAGTAPSGAHFVGVAVAF
jgi:hypothetical protein